MLASGGWAQSPPSSASGPFVGSAEFGGSPGGSLVMERAQGTLSSTFVFQSEWRIPIPG